MFWYNKTVDEFDLVQHQISFACSSDVRLSFASPNITCHGKTNLMLDSVSSNNCLIFVIEHLHLIHFCRLRQSVTGSELKTVLSLIWYKVNAFIAHGVIVIKN